MNREIKFRAWDSEIREYRKSGQIQLSSEGRPFILVPLNSALKVQVIDNIIIEFFTGLKDMDGQEIYEGDIVEFDQKEWGSDNNKFVVEWDKENAGWSFGGGTTSDMHWRVVIGNIHENPELLNPESCQKQNDTAQQ